MPGQSHPEIDVVIVTRNRARQLRDVLQCLALQRTSADWTLTIVDNGSTDDTRDVIGSFHDRLPIVTLWEPQAGKSRSLNRALDAPRAPLQAFVDDDVRMGADWISEYLRAARTYPDAAVLCGPIVPEFPAGVPHWLTSHRFSDAAFARFQPSVCEGPLPMSALPFGPNFALRSSRVAGMRFRLDLGPSDRGSLMCEDVEFFSRVRHRGDPMIFVPAAGVVHRIRGELTSLPGLYERAFNLGRSLILITERATPLRAVLGRRAQGDATVDRFEAAVKLNMFVGQLCQLCEHGDDREKYLVSAFVRSAGWTGEREWLGRSAAAWLDAHDTWRASIQPPAAATPTPRHTEHAE